MRIGRLAVRVVAVAVLVFGIVLMHHVVRSGHEASAAERSPVTASTQPGALQHRTMAGAAAADDDSASAGAAMGQATPSAAHGLLHLCLAVLTAAVLVVTGWLLLASRPWVTALSSRLIQVWRAPSRSPPRPYGSALLVSLCVMRT